MFNNVTDTITIAVHEYYRDFLTDVVANSVAILTRLLTWIVVTEVIFVIADALHPHRAVSLGMYLNPFALFTGDPYTSRQLTHIALLLYSFAAIPAVLMTFRLFLFLVTVQRKVHQADRRHVAYAWSSGVIGLLCVFIEAATVLDFRFEDLLIGAGGLNMLVEGIRLLERRPPDENDHHIPLR